MSTKAMMTTATTRVRVAGVAAAAVILVGLGSLTAPLDRTAEAQRLLPADPDRRTLVRAADKPVVTVMGQGRFAATPNRATVTLGAEFQDDSAVQAQSRVNATVERITSAIRELEVEGLMMQTSAINLSPVYTWNQRANQRERQLEGYRASIALTVRIDEIDRVGAVIDAAMEAGANEMRGVSFGLVDDSDAKGEAMQDAVREAQRKAEKIASTLGMRLGDLVEVQEAGAVRPITEGRGGTRAMSMQAEARMAPTPIEAGELEVTASVQLTYRLDG